MAVHLAGLVQLLHHVRGRDRPAGTPYAGFGVTAYEYAFADATLTHVFFYATFGQISGSLQVAAEIIPNQNILLNDDFFGCAGAWACGSIGQGIHYHIPSTGWVPWTGHGGVNERDNPPALLTYNANWSFETCPGRQC